MQSTKLGQSTENALPPRSVNPTRFARMPRKLRAVQVSDHFQAILGCLLGEDWTTPRLVEMVITPDGHLLGRCEGEAAFKAFLGASDSRTSTELASWLAWTASWGGLMVESFSPLSRHQSKKASVARW